MFQVHVSLTNETKGHRFSDYTEDVSGVETPGEIYRIAQREYGVCRSRVCVDTPTGTKAIGWYFESRQRYEDTNEPYLRGAWVTYQEIEDKPGQIDCDTCWGVGELAPMVTCPTCHGSGMIDA